MRELRIIGISCVCCLLGWAANYVADGPDAGRTGWVKSEKVFNKTNVKTMKLLWKAKLDVQTRAMHSLFPPVVLENVATPAGPKEIAIVSGISDELWAFDTSNGKQLWHKHFDSTYADATGGRGGGTLCPGGQTATPVVGPGNGPGKYTLYAISWDGRVREVNVADGEDLAVPQNFMPPNAKPWSLNMVNGVIYTSNSQGCGGNPNAFYAYDLATKTSSALRSPGGGMWGRRGVAVASDGTVWMGTGDGYYNPETNNLGDSLVGVKLDANKQLQLAGWFAPPNVNFLWHHDLDINVSPMAIDHKGKHLIFGSSKECRLWMVDQATAMGTDPGIHHQQMLDRSPLVCNPAGRYDAAGVWGAMAAWEDPAGQLFVAMPFLGPLTDGYKAPIEVGTPVRGGVTVMKVDDVKWKLIPAWTFGDIDQGDEAIYENGILFVDAAGEDTFQGAGDQPGPDNAWDEAPRKTGGRPANSRHSTIYALDAASGKLLWSSGEQMPSWSHGGGMTAVNGKVYMGTFDGMFYCFGVGK